MIRAKLHTGNGKVLETTHEGEDTVIEIESLWEAVKMLPTALQIAALYYRYKSSDSEGSSEGDEGKEGGTDGSMILKYGSLELELG